MQTRKLNFRSQKGFSMIELLIAITLTSIIFVVVSSVIITTMTSNTKSKQSQTLEQTKNDLAADLSNNIKWAARITVDPLGNSFVLNDGSTVYDYKLDGGIITKGGSALTSSQVKVTSFTANRLLSSLEITVDMENKANPTIKDSLKLILSPRGKNILE